MGFMTLGDFKQDMQSALGDRVTSPDRFLRWINFGYLDLCGSVDFEILDEEDTAQSSIIGDQNLLAPENPLVIKIVRNMTDELILGWIPKNEFYRRDFITTGQPEFWTRHKENIKLNPTPSSVKNYLIIWKKSPVLLEEDTDKTILPDIWDPAVFLLSVHHALMAIGEEQRSVAWLSKAITFIQSRLTEIDFHEAAPGLGASLPIGMHKLLARLPQGGV